VSELSSFIKNEDNILKEQKTNALIGNAKQKKVVEINNPELRTTAIKQLKLMKSNDATPKKISFNFNPNESK
jgi:hypothetical protein